MLIMEREGRVIWESSYETPPSTCPPARTVALAGYPNQLGPGPTLLIMGSWWHPTMPLQIPVRTHGRNHAVNYEEWEFWWDGVSYCNGYPLLRRRI